MSRIVSGARPTSARVVIISLTYSPPPYSRHSVRNGWLVMPAIGASTTGGDTTNGPMRSAVALAGVVVVAAGVTRPLSQGRHRADESGASTRPLSRGRPG